MNEELPLQNAKRRRLLASSAGALAVVGMGTHARVTWAGDAPAAASTAQPAAAAGSAAASKAKPLPAYAAWKNADDLIVHSANTIETKRTAFGDGVITPSSQLYVRNNVPPPNASVLDDVDAWEVSIEGVKSPRTFTVGELKQMGVETMAMVLQCSGNGRKFFEHKPSGTPWDVGAAGCVMWSGIPVRDVIDAVGGVAGDAPYMTGRGGETLPEGIDPNTLMVERSVPVDAMKDAMLAWEMNGEPISLAHGGPLRLIVPGYSGVNNVKYIKRLAFTKEQSPAMIQQARYRFAPLGVKETPDHPAIWKMDVKSWINGPESGSQVSAGKRVIKGVAFGGTDAVKRVEVSTDGGKSWKDAKFVGPDLGKYAWRQFALMVDLAPGEYRWVSRATDAQGNVQPEQRVENAAGYMNSSWRDHGLDIKVIA